MATAGRGGNRRPVRIALVAAVAVVAGLTGACSDRSARVEVSSPAFRDGHAIPERFSCLGLNVSPPLRWKGLPASTREVALVVADPDAPSGTFFHWLLYGIPAATTSLREGEVPAGAHQGKASSEAVAYVGMCPPDGETHRYHFTVYALDRHLALPDGASPAEVLAAVKDAKVEVGELTGTFHQ